MEPKAFEIYRHFKGNLYQVMALAEEEETGNMLVVYQGLYAPFKVYARPLSAFVERLDPVKYPDAAQEYRFERVTDMETVAASSAGASRERTTADVTAERLPKGQAAADVSAERLPESQAVADMSAVRLPESQAVTDVIDEKLPGDQTAADVTAERFPEDQALAATEEIPAGTSAQSAPEEDMAESAEGINPDLLLFLDAREPEDKLDALFRIKSRLTPDMLTVIEMSQGMEPQEAWSIEERYKHIKNDIITKQKYEQKRI